PQHRVGPFWTGPLPEDPCKDRPPWPRLFLTGSSHSPAVELEGLPLRQTSAKPRIFERVSTYTSACRAAAIGRIGESAATRRGILPVLPIVRGTGVVTIEPREDCEVRGPGEDPVAFEGHGALLPHAVANTNLPATPRGRQHLDRQRGHLAHDRAGRT